VRHETVYPGFPVALSGLYRLFGSHVIFAADVLVFLCAIGSLALVYRLILLAFDRPTAVLITAGVAFSHEFFQFSFEILTDMPFLLGVMAVLAAHEAIFVAPASRGRAKGWNWILLAAGLIIATTTRPTMIGLLMAWVAALLYAAVIRRNWKAGLGFAFCAIVVGGFFFVDPRRFAGHGFAGGYEQYAIHQLSQFQELKTTAAANLQALLDPIVAKAAFGMRLWPPLANPIVAVVVTLAAVALIFRRLFWGLWVVLTFATVILFVSNDRYLLPILPMLVLGWWMLVRAINTRLPNRFGNSIALILLLLSVGPNMVQIGGTIIHQRSRPFLAAYQGGRYEAFANIAPEITRTTSPTDVVICPPKTARMMAFLADRLCFEQNEPYPTDKTLFLLVDPGDADYIHWLHEQNLRQVGPPIAVASRHGGKDSVYLVRAGGPAR
jgi:hypothetical protein